MLAFTPQMLFMVVEGFKDGNAVPVYRRFRAHGRLLTDEVSYVNSWVSADLTMCFQVMEAPSRSLLEAWLDRWRDLVDFEVVEVLASAEASEAVKVLEQ